MSTAYKSKDVEYMSMLKKAVLKGMRGAMPEEKTHTWEYVRKQVTIDDLQSYTVSRMGKIVGFPTAGFNADLMVIFRNKPRTEELDILYKMTDARCIPRDKIYVTWLHKAEPESEEEQTLLTTVINSEISIISPELILSFGLNFNHEQHQVTNFKEAKLITTYDMNYLFQANESTPLAERKQALWNDVLKLTEHYNPN